MAEDWYVVLKIQFLNGFTFNWLIQRVFSPYSAQRALKRKLKSQLVGEFGLNPRKLGFLRAYAHQRASLNRRKDLLVKLFPI
jgi:hypothetical protein